VHIECRGRLIDKNDRTYIARIDRTRIGSGYAACRVFRVVLRLVVDLLVVEK
jgi:hypothetical protein